MGMRASKCCVLFVLYGIGRIQGMRALSASRATRVVRWTGGPVVIARHDEYPPWYRFMEHRHKSPCTEE